MVDRESLLHMIISNLGENWYESGVDENGKAYSKTDSEVAMKGLLETLFNLGYEEYYEIEERDQLGEIKPDYRFEDGCNNGLWYVTVREL